MRLWDMIAIVRQGISTCESAHESLSSIGEQAAVTQLKVWASERGFQPLNTTAP